MKNVRVKPWELEAAASLGRVEAMTEVARKMLADGKNFDEIHKYTGLSVRDFEKRSLDFSTFEEFDKDCSRKCSCNFSENAREDTSRRLEDFWEERPDRYEDDDSWRYDDEEDADGFDACDGSDVSDAADGFAEAAGIPVDEAGNGPVDLPVSAPKTVPIEDVVINEELRLRLMGWRVERHKVENVPIYMIMHNKTLLEIAALVPKTKEEFMAVRGFGAMKWEKYGEELMKITSEY